MKYEEALKAVGGHEHRPYQLKLLLVCCLSNFVSGYIMTSFPFLSYRPLFLCRSSHSWEPCSEVCIRPSMDWKYSPESFQSITAEFQMTCDRAWLVSYLSFLQMVGGLVGTMVFGMMMDAVGRRRGNLLATGITIISLVLALGASTSYGLLLSFLLIGIGASPLSIISKAYMTEFLGPQRSLYMQAATIAFALGRAGNVVSAIYFQQWRPILIVAICVSTVLFLLEESLYESPKYTLLIQKNVKSTLQILAAVRVYNRWPLFENLVLQSPDLTPDTAYHIYAVRRKYRSKILIQCLHYFISGCGYFIIVFNQRNIGGDLYCNGLLLAVTEILSGFSAGYIADRAGRKAVYLTHFPLAFVACFVMSVVPGSLLGVLQGLNLLASYAVSTCAAMPSVLAGELFPTVIRGTAGTVSTMCLRVGGMLAPLVVIYFQELDVHPMLFVAFLSILGLLAVPALPETRGKEVNEDEPSGKIQV